MAELDEALYRTLVESLEDLANLLPQHSPSPDMPSAAWESDMIVAFKGPVKGHLRVSFYGKLAAELAARMAGAALTPAVKQDALGEFVNVVCGNVLPFAFGAEAIFRMDPPRSELRGKAGCGRVKARAEVHLADGRIDAHLCAHDR